MEAPPLREGNFIQPPGCPLCHCPRPINGRVAVCGHVYCLLCLKDMQLTAMLQSQMPTCKICYTDVSDLESLVFTSHRVLPLSTPSSANTGNVHQGLTMGDLAAVMVSRSAASSSPIWDSTPIPPPELLQSQLRNIMHHTQVASFQELQGHVIPPGLLQYHGYGYGYLNKQINHTAPAIKFEKKGTSIGQLKGITFYLKGNIRRGEEARRNIMQNGGRLSSGATKHTDYIVMGEGARKTKSMQENGGTVLDENGFWAFVKEKTEDLQEQFDSLFEGDASKEGSGLDMDVEEITLRGELSTLKKRAEEMKRKLEDIDTLKAKMRKL